MINAKLHTNELLSINGRIVGQVLAITATGNVQNATAHRAQIASQFRPIIASGKLGEPIRFDVPVYISTGASDHHLNPALVKAIAAHIA